MFIKHSVVGNSQNNRASKVVKVLACRYLRSEGRQIIKYNRNEAG